MPKTIVCVAGPTASGKTKLGVLLAGRYDGEIVSADSMQIYRGMVIGTAAPTPEEMEGIPHHLIGIADPTEAWSAGRYARTAIPVVEDILARGKLPIVVGGTGLWMEALVRGRTFAPGQAGSAVREALERELQAGGMAPLLAGSTPRMKSGSSGPWRSTGRPGNPFPSGTRRRPPAPPSTTP